jgi:hypothetical protein
MKLLCHAGLEKSLKIVEELKKREWGLVLGVHVLENVLGKSDVDVKRVEVEERSEVRVAVDEAVLPDKRRVALVFAESSTAIG